MKLVCRRYPLSMLFMALLLACGSKEMVTIPIDELTPRLKSKGDFIASEVFASLTASEGARYLLKKSYSTPKIHGRIMHNLEMYQESYTYCHMILGSSYSYELYQVIDKGVIKRMRYKIVSPKEDIKFMELIIDVNNEYKLADFYLLLTTADGTLNSANILPAEKKH